MPGIFQSPSTCQAPSAWQSPDLKCLPWPSELPDRRNKPLSINWRVVLVDRGVVTNPYATRPATRLRSCIATSSRLRSPHPQKYLSTEFYYRRQGASQVVAKANNGDGEGVEDESATGRLSVIGAAQRFQTALQIFVAALIYIIYFFGASAWDGKGRKR